MLALLLMVCLPCRAVERVLLLDASPEAFARDGLDRHGFAPFEDAMRTDGGKGTVEWWYFDASLDDGTQVVVNFMTKPIMKRKRGLGPKLELTVTTPDGVEHRSFTRHSADVFQASAESLDVRIASSWVSGDPETLELHAEGEGVAVDMRFTRAVPSWRPGAGRVYFDDALQDYMGWVVAMPAAEVEATVTVGARTWTVSGQGYHDHNWTNAPINRCFDYWYWGRGQLGDTTVLFFQGVGARRWDHATLDLGLLATPDAGLRDLSGRLTLTPTELQATKKGPDWPTRLTVEARDPDSAVSLDLSVTDQLESEQLLAVLPQPIRALAGLFMQPWYMRFEAEGVLTETGEDAPAPTTGSVVYELMQFR